MGTKFPKGGGITRDRNSLEDLLAQRSKIKVLRFLLGNREAVSGREMARLTGLDHKTCHRALKDFSRHGIVLVTHASNRNLYRLNSENHLVNKIIYPLFEKERTILNGKKGLFSSPRNNHK